MLCRVLVMFVSVVSFQAFKVRLTTNNNLRNPLSQLTDQTDMTDRDTGNELLSNFPGGLSTTPISLCPGSKVCWSPCSLLRHRMARLPLHEPSSPHPHPSRSRLL